jgi:hypothetical protein
MFKLCRVRSFGIAQRGICFDDTSRNQIVELKALMVFEIRDLLVDVLREDTCPGPVYRDIDDRKEAFRNSC